MVLDGFVDGIRSDPTTKEKMPKDGTVFQLTSNVLLFLEQLLDFTDTVAAILTTQDTSYNQMLLRIPRKISGKVFVGSSLSCTSLYQVTFTN
jgi:exocyst complex protein 7